MQTPLTIATDYLALWNEASTSERRARLDAWHPDAAYRDPLVQSEGRDAVASMIETVTARFPGHAFRLQGVPEGYGPFVRFSWTLAPNGGAAVAAGTDIMRLGDDGRIVEVIGFLDEVRP